MTALPETPVPSPNGAAPLPFAAPSPPGQWIVVGPRTRANLARALEQSPVGNPVLVALLEQRGVPDGQGYRLVVDGCHLEPEAPP